MCDQYIVISNFVIISNQLRPYNQTKAVFALCHELQDGLAKYRHHHLWRLDTDIAPLAITKLSEVLQGHHCLSLPAQRCPAMLPGIAASWSDWCRLDGLS